MFLVHLESSPKLQLPTLQYRANLSKAPGEIFFKGAAGLQTFFAGAANLNNHELLIYTIAEGGAAKNAQRGYALPSAWMPLPFGLEAWWR
jgi:hypothetical protein